MYHSQICPKSNEVSGLFYLWTEEGVVWVADDFSTYEFIKEPFAGEPYDPDLPPFLQNFLK
jgi:hypothetical protein